VRLNNCTVLFVIDCLEVLLIIVDGVLKYAEIIIFLLLFWTYVFYKEQHLHIWNIYKL
jgi:hypothetical protein